MPSIAFDNSKDETFTLSRNFKTLSSKLSRRYKMVQWKHTIETLGRGDVNKPDIFIFPGPVQALSETEYTALVQYLSGGGRVIIMAPSIEQGKINGPLLKLLQNKGINPSVTGIVASSVQIGRHPRCPLVKNALPPPVASTVASSEITQISLPYANICSAKGPILVTSGDNSLPANSPVCVLGTKSKFEKRRQGEVLCFCGSSAMFSDNYISEGDNLALAEYIFDTMYSGLDPDVSQQLILYGANAGENDEGTIPSIGNKNNNDGRQKGTSVALIPPDMELLSNMVHACTSSIGDEHSSFGNGGIHTIKSMVDKMSTNGFEKSSANLIYQVSKLYKELGVERGPLTIVPPRWERPLPQLRAAVHPPPNGISSSLRLELFDLDTEFSTKETRLGKLAMGSITSDKPTTLELQSFILNAAKICDIQGNEREVLYTLMKTITDFKCHDLCVE